MTSDEGITHVSDTALMVAACRAMEYARPDGLVRDPFAERLAGARGMAIAHGLPGVEMLCFGVGIRSRFLDELIAGALSAQTIATVLSVGAGLDTRPWRLDLPAGLRWIEIDFPALLEYKAAIMASEAPRCRLEQLAADLNDAAQRQAAFAAAGDRHGLMITEGLLAYLPAETVGALASEPLARTGIRHWLLDVASPYLERRSGGLWRPAVDNVRAASHLNGLEILDVLRRNGWTPLRHRSYTRDAMEAGLERIRALAGAQAAAQQATPPPPDDVSGVYLFGI